MYIPRYDDVALLIMLELAVNYGKGKIPLSKISQDHGISVLFLKKLAASLKQAGLIRSREGISGGYELSSPPETISLWNIIGVFSKNFLAGGSKIRGLCRCPIKDDCLPQKVHLTMDRALQQSFSNIYLSELKKDY
jgi:Rrf2 family protein